MFGFGKKKLQAEFVEILAGLGNISETQAQRYFENNSKFINESFSRGLDAFACVAYVAEWNMEKIHDAHAIDDLSLIADVPDFLLLVALQAMKAMQAANVPSEQLNYNFRYWDLVIKIPVDAEKPEFTYGDKLHELVDALNKK